MQQDSGHADVFLLKSQVNARQACILQSFGSKNSIEHSRNVGERGVVSVESRNHGNPGETG